MFETFSTYARQVVFLARFKAGRRGANAIGVDDFAVALILEDQGMIGTVVAEMIYGDQELGPTLPPEDHSSFLPAEIAFDLLTKIEGSLPQSEATPLSTETPISSELERVCDAAKNLQYKFQLSQIEPLHLLAAVLTEESSQFTRLLREVGITYDQVLQRLRTATKD